MENSYKLGKVEAISLIIVAMINKLILNIPYYIVDLVGNGAIVNIIYIGLIDFFLLLFIIKLFKKFESSDIIDIAEFLGGKILKNIAGIISISLFLLVSAITLLDFSNVLRTIYFYNFSIVYILLFFIIGILLANFIGFKSIARITCLIAPFAIISVLIAFGTIWNNINIKNLTPILGDSYQKTFITGASNCFAMYIIVYFYFIKPLLKDGNANFKKISIFSYIISLLLLLLTVISMLTIFNSSSSKEPINSLFLLARQLELGNFVQRIDALFILLWILSIFTYLSLIVFMINRIIKKLINISNERMLSFSTCSILFGLALIPFNISQFHFIENVIYRYSVIGFIFGFGIILLLLANFKKIKKGKL